MNERVRGLSGQQISHQISFKLLNMIFFDINSHLVKK